MFQQSEETSSPVTDWSWRFLSEASVVENTVGWPTYQWMPDGHISTIRVTFLGRKYFSLYEMFYQGNKTWLTFYPNHESYRAKGPSPFPEDAVKLLPSSKILGGKSSQERYNNGGEWLNSVFQTGPGKHLTGFVHAEYHYTEQGQGKVHKSISLGQVSVSQI